MAAPASSTPPGKLMMIGWPTPTVEPPAGRIFGGPNGAVPVNGAGFCPAAGAAAAGCANGLGGGGASGSPGAGGGGGGATKGGCAGGPAGAATTPGSPGAGSGSAKAGPAPSTSRAANPAAFRAAKRLPLVQLGICIPPVRSDLVSHRAVASYLIRDPTERLRDAIYAR